MKFVFLIILAQQGISHRLSFPIFFLKEDKLVAALSPTGSILIWNTLNNKKETTISLESPIETFGVIGNNLVIYSKGKITYYNYLTYKKKVYSTEINENSLAYKILPSIRYTLLLFENGHLYKLVGPPYKHVLVSLNAYDMDITPDEMRFLYTTRKNDMVIAYTETGNIILEKKNIVIAKFLPPDGWIGVKTENETKKLVYANSISLNEKVINIGNIDFIDTLILKKVNDSVIVIGRGGGNVKPTTANIITISLKNKKITNSFKLEVPPIYFADISINGLLMVFNDRWGIINFISMINGKILYQLGEPQYHNYRLPKANLKKYLLASPPATENSYTRIIIYVGIGVGISVITIIIVMIGIYISKKRKKSHSS